jgi:DNA primase
MNPSAKLDKEYLRALKAACDVRGLLLSYGARIMFDNSDGIRSNCIVHGGTNPTSLVYSYVTMFFKCFGECGFSGDVFQLVQELEGCGFTDAVKIVKRFCPDIDKRSLQKSVASQQRRSTGIFAEMERMKRVEENPVIDGTLVNKAQRTLKRKNPYAGKFETSTLEYFEIGYCDFNEYFMDRAIIPIHNAEGKLVGFSGRDMKNPNPTHKYRIKKGFRKGVVLYNLHRAAPHIDRKHPMVIVEGFGQTWRLHEAGVDTAIALMGKEATEEQLSLILKNTTSVVLGLDFDVEGVKGTRKLIDKLIDQIDVSVMVSDLPEKVDLGDMTPKQALQCYGRRVSADEWVNTVYREWVSKHDS